jgi:hypothetical protein
MFILRAREKINSDLKELEKNSKSPLVENIFHYYDNNRGAASLESHED